MAIYHFSGTIISRSQGRSAVACAAYRSGQRLIDLRQNRDHDYTRKLDVAHTEILLPESAPLWMRDREMLWNAVESSEKRKDAQLAREFTIALPRELTIEQNIVLVRAFVQSEWVNRGMIADVCVHNDLMTDGNRQPHAHVMLTLREVTPDGFGQKVRDWNAKAHLLAWRQSWAEFTNQHLAMNGHSIQIDHRRLVDQEIALEPQYKIGSSVAQEKLARLADHQRIARENGERIYRDPSIALQGLTMQQSTFTSADLARFIHRHTDTAEQFQRVYAKVNASPSIVRLGEDAQGQTRLTTQDMLLLEQHLMAHARDLSANGGHGVATAVTTSVLERYASLSDEQRWALAHVTDAGDLKSVVGYAGTGKSYVLGAAREAWELAGYRVQGITLSGIAAENLTASSGIESRTLASCVYGWDQQRQTLSGRDIVVVDEAGLIGSRQMERVLQEAQVQGAKVVLVGDPQQLQAIEAGAAFRAITDRHPPVALTEIRRQQVVWQKTATQALAQGEVRQALADYAGHDHVHCFATKAEAREQLIQLWQDARLASPEKTQMILAYTREEVQHLNALARGLREQQQELGVSSTFATVRGERQLAEQDRIYFLKNDKTLGVKNGTLGTIESICGTWLTVRLDGVSSESRRQVAFDITQYTHVDQGYAATFHKSQGVTVDRGYVLATRAMDSHSAYVGLTRHRESCDLFYSQDEFKDTYALSTQLGRDRRKDISLDYGTVSSHAQEWGHTSADAADLHPNVDAHRMHPSHDSLADSLSNREGVSKSCSQPLSSTDLAQRILRAEHEFEVLETALTQLGTRAAREALTQYAGEIARDKELLSHIQTHHPHWGRQIEQLNRRHTQTLSRNLEIER